MKRIISFFLIIAVLTALSSGCGNAGRPSDNGKIKIVTTIFPEYDWVREILGSNIDTAELTLLLDNGADMHNYQPSADDMVKISDCDMVLYVGGQSDKWVEEALRQSSKKKRVVISLLEILGDSAKMQEHVEGMQEDAHDEEQNHDEYDEHVWLSLKNAMLFCREIAERLGEIDPDRKNDYAKNSAEYIESLSALDADYKAAVEGATKKTLLFGDRFPFRYMTDDYGLKYYAAFDGCSAETEASFKTVTFLAGKADELGINCILTIEGSDKRLARTIISNTRVKSQKVLSVDSMQSVNADDLKKGKTYLSVMKKNLEVLKQALK